jgi:alpha-ketoglutaric semialdehyde dehydrogenase
LLSHINGVSRSFFIKISAMANNFKEESVEEINIIMQQSQSAFEAYQKTSAEQKALFLEAIADEIEALGDALLQKASEDTNLPYPA